MIIPSFEIVLRWLKQAKIGHYMCDQCHGIHIADLQTLEGVLESRLFVDEPEGLMFTTELELRPTGLLPLVADLGRLNMNYPTLKLFVDLVDDNLPRLMACAHQYTQAGLTQEQLSHFVRASVTAMQQVQSECERLGYINLPEGPSAPEAVH